MTSRIARDRASQTIDVSQSIVNQLMLEFGNELAVEFYPEDPKSYRLNHANGALLVQYGKSKYRKQDDSYAVLQVREMTVKVIILSRNLHERLGAIKLVDWVCEALQGFTPRHCDRPISITDDYFMGHNAGLWLYGVDISTTSERVQALEVKAV